MSITNYRRGNTHWRRLLAFAPTAFFFAAIMQFVIQLAFMRFLLYHQQYQILPADSYTCRIYTADDYRKLTDPSMDTVVVSDGTQLSGRSQTWYDIVLPQIKRVDDNHYVEVTTLGTAHYFRNWLTATMPMVILCLIGLVVSICCIHSARGASDQSSQRLSP